PRRFIEVLLRSCWSGTYPDYAFMTITVATNPPWGGASTLPGAVSTLRVLLKPGHVKPVWAGHPWVYAQAIARIEGGSPAAGDVVQVVDTQEHLLGRGFWSPGSAIPVRLVTRGDEPLDDAALG